MNKENKIVSFKQLDLLFFSILAIVSEIMSSVLLEQLGSGFYFSFSTVICLIAMIRWGAVGAIVGMMGGIPGMLLSDMSFWSGLLFYVAANAALSVPMLLYGNRNRDRIVESHVYLLLYILLSHVCLSVGKGIVIFIVTGEITGIVDHFGATFFILVINIIVCLVLRMRKGLICDMRYYFVEEEGEGNEEGRD